MMLSRTVFNTFTTDSMDGLVLNVVFAVKITSNYKSEKFTTNTSAFTKFRIGPLL